MPNPYQPPLARHLEIGRWVNGDTAGNSRVEDEHTPTNVRRRTSRDRGIRCVLGQLLGGITIRFARPSPLSKEMDHQVMSISHHFNPAFATLG